MTNELIDNSQAQPLIEFMKTLNRKPDSNDVLINDKANNTKYVPISKIESLLDELFLGLWETDNFQYQQIVNEVVGSITLKVYHPILKIWIKRTGAASVMITQQSGAKISDLDKKQKNAMEMAFPHLKADCLSNAAKSLGKLFGRDLNRKDSSIGSMGKIITELSNTYDQLISEIKLLSYDEIMGNSDKFKAIKDKQFLLNDEEKKRFKAEVSAHARSIKGTIDA